MGSRSAVIHADLLFPFLVECVASVSRYVDVFQLVS
jgi:hypothetical protein